MSRCRDGDNGSRRKGEGDRDIAIPERQAQHTKKHKVTTYRCIWL